MCRVVKKGKKSKLKGGKIDGKGWGGEKLPVSFLFPFSFHLVGPMHPLIRYFECVTY